VIVGVSTSSPVTSVALLGPDGSLLAQARREAARNASATAIALLQELLDGQAASLADAEGFLADRGPGGFTGVKVGVTLAKMWAFAGGVWAAGVDSFDLIAPGRTVAVPYKRGHFLVREPGKPVHEESGVPDPSWVGYGMADREERYPEWTVVHTVWPGIERLDPIALVPFYGAEPSISTPKTPYRTLPGRDGLG
jgi:tRNA threonylcarbamoyl adenosine modification protein YeaZ